MCQPQFGCLSTILNIGISSIYNAVYSVFFKSKAKPFKVCLNDLHDKLRSVLAAKRRKRFGSADIEVTTYTELLFVSKWVYVPDEHCFGYQLSDGSIGAHLNDNRLSSVILQVSNSNRKNIIEGEYVGLYHGKRFFSLESFPDELMRKVYLLEYFISYFKDSETLIKTSPKIDYRSMINSTVVAAWFEIDKSTIMVLSNGTVQVCFSDHTTVLLSSVTDTITFIDKSGILKTYKLSVIERHGCSYQLLCCIRYAELFVRHLIDVLRLDKHVNEQI